MSLGTRARFLGTVAAVGIAASMLVGIPSDVALAAGLQLFDQPFHNNTADGEGAVALPTGPGANFACLTASGNTTGPLPRSCGASLDTPGLGKLRLTDSSGNRTGAVFAAASLPTAQGLDITFDAFQYGGNSADGLTLVLAATDPAVAVAPTSVGQPGGSLGYTPAGSGAGVPYGYLGFGFDVYGNFSSPSFQGTGCTNPSYMDSTLAGQVVVRGPGNGLVGYCGLNSTAATGGASPPVVPLRATGRAASAVPVEAVINPSSASITTTSGLIVLAKTYKIVFTPVGQAQRTLTGALPVVAAGMYPASWLNADGIPKQLAVGWVGTTGGSTDFHEVDDTHIASLTGAAVPSLTVAQTAYTAAALVAGDPVSYEVVVGVQPGPPETYAITVTETLPAGVVPVAGSGVGWVCLPPSGQVMTCTNSTVPFLAGSVLPTLTITGTVTTAGVTPTIVQTDSIVTAFSADAIAVTGGETGWLNTGDVPVRVHGPVYSDSTIVTSGGSGIQCSATWPLAPGTSGCNGIYVDEQVTAESTCSGRIVTPTFATKNCSTGVHTPAGDDPAIAAPTSYAQPTANMVLQTLPVCSAGSSIVAFTPGFYDNAVGLSALTSGAAACKNKTFWFPPGIYYFDFHNSEMPTSGSPIIPNGPDLWTFNDTTSVIVGGTKQGWTTSGITAAALPGACVSPLASKTAAGVQFVFADDSRLYQKAGSMELCGTYSATNPPIVLSGSTGAGGSATQAAVLRPTAISSFSVPVTPVYTPVTSATTLASEVDGVGPTITAMARNSAATLRINSVSGYAGVVGVRSVMESATVTVKHSDRTIAVGDTMKAVFTSSRAGSTPITRDLTLSYNTAALTSSTQVVDMLDGLKADMYAYGGETFTLDLVLTTGTTVASRTQMVDFAKMELTWKTIALRPQAGCVTLSAGCAVMSTSSDAGMPNELYFQGTVYVPKAKVNIAIRVADGPVFADGVIARAFVLQSDAYSGGVVYDGDLIQIPDLRGEATPLLVYLTAWSCTTQTACVQPPSLATGNGWKVVGRTMVQYVDLASGATSGQRDVSIKTWQLPR